MKTDLLERIFYSACAENGYPSEERRINQLYERMPQTKALWDPVEDLLEKTHVTSSVLDDFENAVAALADAFEQQGFINGFRLGMMLREELTR